MTLGKYIVIEGHDGTGKSTQIALLKTWLKEHKNIDTLVIEEPAGTPIADEIRAIIKNGTLERAPMTNLLLFTASRYEIWKKAEAALNNGTWVLASRNWLSTLAYQGYGEGVDKDLIYKATELFTSPRYLAPDHTLILTVDTDTRKQRIEQRGELKTPDAFEQRAQEFQEKVGEGYRAIAEQYGYPIIDASCSIEDLAVKVRQHLALEP